MKSRRSPRPAARKMAVIRASPIRSRTTWPELDCGSDGGGGGAPGPWRCRGGRRRARLLRDQRHTSDNATSELPVTSTAGHHGPGPGPGLLVGRQDGFHLVNGLVPPGVQGLGHHVGDAAPGQAPGQERLHRDLVGRAQPRRGRSPADPGAVGQVDAAEDRAVRGLEGQRGRGWSSPARRRAPANGRASPGRSRWAAACRGRRAGPGWSRRATPPWSARSTAGAPRSQCGRRRSPNNSCASITSRPLFIRVDESMVILGPMRQVGWARASATVTAAELRGGPAPEGAARRGEEEAGHGRRPVDGGQALVDGAVLGVHRHDLGPRGAAGLLHHRRAGDERLLVGQGETLARLQRGHGDGEAGEPDDGVQHHVGGARPRPPGRACPPAPRCPAGTPSRTVR